MSECISWESVIPDFQEGDIITPFESIFSKGREADYIVNGGSNTHDYLEECAAIRKQSTQKVGVYHKSGKQILPEIFDECKPEIYDSFDFYVSAIKTKIGRYYGLHRNDGHQIVPEEFVSVSIQGYIVIVKAESGYLGAYSLEGKQILDCDYVRMKFHGSLDKGCGYIEISTDRWCGLKKEDGSDLIPVEYLLVQTSDMRVSGFDVCNYNDQKEYCHGWYSRDGKYHIPCEFKHFIDFSINVDNTSITLILAETHQGLKGVYSQEGKKIMPSDFKEIRSIGNYLIGVIGEGEISVYSIDGKCLYSSKTE